MGWLSKFYWAFKRSWSELEKHAASALHIVLALGFCNLKMQEDHHFWGSSEHNVLRPRNWEWCQWSVERPREWEQWVFFFFFCSAWILVPKFGLRYAIVGTVILGVPTYENDFKNIRSTVVCWHITFSPHFSRIQDKSYILQLTWWSRPWFKGVSRPCTFRQVPS